jgi:hypothetical protein
MWAHGCGILPWMSVLSGRASRRPGRRNSSLGAPPAARQPNASSPRHDRPMAREVAPPLSCPPCRCRWASSRFLSSAHTWCDEPALPRACGTLRWRFVRTEVLSRFGRSREVATGCGRLCLKGSTSSSSLRGCRMSPILGAGSLPPVGDRRQKDSPGESVDEGVDAWPSVGGWCREKAASWRPSARRRRRLNSWS